MFVTRAPLYEREFSVRVKLSTHSPAGVVGVDVDAAAVVVVVAGVVVAAVVVLPAATIVDVVVGAASLMPSPSSA